MSATLAPAVPSASLREALARWPSGVTVVTTADAAGRPRGFTATAFSALSLSPPLVLVCLALTAECRPAFEQAGTFAVHILGSAQRDLAERFATRGADKFAGIVPAYGLSGAPLLPDAAALLECRIQDRLPGGDHMVLIGRVEWVALGGDLPLLYHRREFVELPPRLRPPALASVTAARPIPFSAHSGA